MNGEHIHEPSESSYTASLELELDDDDDDDGREHTRTESEATLLSVRNEAAMMLVNSSRFVPSCSIVLL